MKTFAKTVAGFILFIIAVIVGLNIYFSGDRLKETVMPYVNEAVGREVQVESISLNFFSTFPNPGLRIRQLNIPGETPADTLISLDEFVIGIKLFPLLRNEISISEIQVGNPRFTYRVYEDSTTNIDFLLQEEEQPTAEESEAYSIDVPYFTVYGGTFGYEDRTSNTVVQFNGFDADISLQYAGLIRSNVEIELGGLSARVNGTQYIEDLPLSLSQSSTIDPVNEIITLENGTFSIRGLALDLTGTISRWSGGTPSVDLQFASSSDDFGALIELAPPEFDEQLEDLETRGSLSISGTLAGIIGGEEAPSFTASIDVSDGYLHFPDLPQPVDHITFNARASREQVAIDRFELTAADNRISLNGIINQPFDDENRTVDLETDLFFDLATVKNFYPIDEDTLAISGLLTARASLAGSAQQITQAVQSGTFTLENGSIDYERLGRPIENITLASSLEGNVMTIENAGFRSGVNDLSIAGTITDYLGEDPLLDLQVEGNGDFAEVQNYYDLSPAITTLTGRASLNLNMKGSIGSPAEMLFNGGLTVDNLVMEGDSLVQPVRNLNGELRLTPSSVDLTGLSFQWGSSDLNLSGALRNYMEYLKEGESRETTPSLTGQLRSNLFNLDELIEWEDTEEETLIELPNLNSSTSASVDTLIVTGVTLRNMEARASTTPSRISLEEATVELFGGSVSGSFIWNVPQPDRTNLSFNGELSNIVTSSFFSEYQVLGPESTFHEHITGSFSADVEYYSELDSYLQPVIPTTRMSGSFTMTESRIEGLPIQERLASLLNADDLRRVDIDESETLFSIENSVLTIENLQLTSEEMGAEMSGTRHLVSNQIDYKLQIYLPPRFRDGIATVISAQGVEALTQENGTILLPLRVTGTQQNPRLQPDQEVIRPIIQEMIRREAGNAIRNLFGN